MNNRMSLSLRILFQLVFAFVPCVLASNRASADFPPAFVNATVNKRNVVFAAGSYNVTAVCDGAFSTENYTSSDTIGLASCYWANTYQPDQNVQIYLQGVVTELQRTDTTDGMIWSLDKWDGNNSHSVVLPTLTPDYGAVTCYLNTGIQYDHCDLATLFACIPANLDSNGNVTPGLSTGNIYWRFHLTGGPPNGTLIGHVGQAYSTYLGINLVAGQQCTYWDQAPIYGSTSILYNPPYSTSVSSGWTVGSDITTTVQFDGSGSGYFYVPAYNQKETASGGSVNSPSPTSYHKLWYEVRLYEVTSP